MSAPQPSNHWNFKERLQALAKQPGGTGVLKLIIGTRHYTARIKCVGVDFVEFSELDPDGEAIATHIYPIREVRGVVTDSVDLHRQTLDRLFQLPDAERP